MLNWLRLIRLPNTFSVISSILAAYLLAGCCIGPDWHDAASLLLLIGASVSLYSGGMVLNDVVDVEADRVGQPSRPLPAGLIDLKIAAGVGVCLLALGVVLALAAGWFSGVEHAVLRCGLISSLLAIAIVLYDVVLKSTRLAAGCMGACRALNILLGASLAPLALEQSEMWLQPIVATTGYSPSVLWFAAAIGVYVMGLTWFARNEQHSQQARSSLLAATAVIVVGVGMLAVLPWICQSPLAGSNAGEIFPVLIVLVSLVPLRRMLQAIAAADGKSLQSAIISLLRTMIVFDAAICFYARPDSLLFPLIAAAMLLPGMLLSRWMYST